MIQTRDALQFASIKQTGDVILKIVNYNLLNLLNNGVQNVFSLGFQE
jgi:hypothetical protein